MGTNSNSLCTYLSVSFQVDPPRNSAAYSVQQIVRYIDLILAEDVHRAGGMFVICLHCTQLNEDSVCVCVCVCEECMIMSS